MHFFWKYLYFIRMSVRYIFQTFRGRTVHTVPDILLYSLPFFRSSAKSPASPCAFSSSSARSISVVQTGHGRFPGLKHLCSPQARLSCSPFRVVARTSMYSRSSSLSLAGNLHNSVSVFLTEALNGLGTDRKFPTPNSSFDHMSPCRPPTGAYQSPAAEIRTSRKDCHHRTSGSRCQEFLVLKTETIRHGDSKSQKHPVMNVPASHSRYKYDASSAFSKILSALTISPREHPAP